MESSTQDTLNEFVQSLDFDETDDALLDEISQFKSHVKFGRVISELPNGGKIVEFDEENDKPYEYNIEDTNDITSDSSLWNENNSSNYTEHSIEEKCYFDVMVGKMEDITDDKGVFKKIIHNGNGYLCPKNALCRVHYSAFLRGEIDPFDSTISRGKHSLIKVGDDEDGLPGLLIGLRTMQKGEVAQFLITPKYGYGELGCPPRIPPHSHVLFEVEMLGFIDRKSLIEYSNTIDKKDDEYLDHNSSMPMRNIINVANTLILEGNDQFKNNNINGAIRWYGKALRLSESCSLSDNEDENCINELYKRIFLNMSLCCLNLKKYSHAITMCHKVLSIEPENLKANFRLGQVYKCCSEFDKSRVYFSKCVEISPSNIPASDEIKIIDKLTEQRNKHLKLFSEKMLGISKSSSNNMEIQMFMASPLFNGELYAHFITKLTKFKNMSNHHELLLPNDFNDNELKHLQVACSQHSIKINVDNRKKIVKLTK